MRFSRHVARVQARDGLLCDVCLVVEDKTDRRKVFFFFFNDPAPTETSPLPLPAPLPISFARESTINRRNGMGLVNVRKRLEGRYGTDASIRVDSQTDHFRVELSIPAETGDLRK